MGLSILMVASECAPYAKTGGLGDVIRGLSTTLQKMGHSVTVFLPYYRSIRNLKLDTQTLPDPVGVKIGDRELEGRLHTLQDSDGPTFVFLENNELYDRDGFYVDPATSKDFTDNDTRFGFFAKAALAY